MKEATQTMIGLVLQMIDIQLLEIGYLQEVSGYLEEKEAIAMAREKVQKQSTKQWETLPVN